MACGLLTEPWWCNCVHIHFLVASCLVALPVSWRLCHRGTLVAMATSHFVHTLNHPGLKALSASRGALKFTKKMSVSISSAVFMFRIKTLTGEYYILLKKSKWNNCASRAHLRKTHFKLREAEHLSTRYIYCYPSMSLLHCDCQHFYYITERPQGLWIVGNPQQQQKNKQTIKWFNKPPQIPGQWFSNR